MVLAGHSNTVNSVVWTGDNMLISGSNDREIRVWNADTGRAIRVLTGHAHWVNKLALSTAAVLRTGQFDHHGKGPRDPEAAQQVLPSRARTHTLTVVLPDLVLSMHSQQLDSSGNIPCLQALRVAMTAAAWSA